MARLATLWLTFAGLLAAASAQAPETPPLPEPHPARSVPSFSEIYAPPPPEKKPNIPREQPRVDKVDPPMAAAHAKCDKLLERAVLDYQPLPPIRAGACEAKAPILVKSIGADPAVVISPPATMTCALAAALFDWFENTVQPAARMLGASVVKIRNASSYKCRRRYGDTDTEISEHALANALDISEFVFASGQRVKVLGNWPYGARSATLPLAPTPPLPNPHRVAAMLVPQNASGSKETTGAIVPVSTRRSVGSTFVAVTIVSTNTLVRPPQSPVAQPPLSPLPQASSTLGSVRLASSLIATSKSNPFVSPLPSGGLTNSASQRAYFEAEKAEAETPVKPTPPRTLQPEEAAAFMHFVHADACKIFETVLGPNANAAHRDHFHLDMKKRRYVKICE